MLYTNLSEIDQSAYYKTWDIHTEIGLYTNLSKIYRSACYKKWEIQTEIGLYTNLSRIDQSACYKTWKIQTEIWHNYCRQKVEHEPNWQFVVVLSCNCEGKDCDKCPENFKEWYLHNQN